MTNMGKRFFAGLLTGALMAMTAGPAAAAIDSAKDIFIRVTSSKQAPYSGEAFVVSYNLYTLVPVIDPQAAVSVTFKNCDQRELPVVPVMQHQQRIRGKIYEVFTLKKYLLIAHTAGALSLPAISFRLKINAASPHDFFGETGLVSRDLASSFSSVTIRALPRSPDTGSFSGAVGDLGLKGLYQVSEKNPDVLWFHLRVSGAGNTREAVVSPTGFPAGLEVYNATTQRTDTPSSDGLHTGIVYSFQLVARYRGHFSVPPVKFIYFDPLRNEYKTYISPGYQWNVTKGPRAPAGPKAADPWYSKNGLYGAVPVGTFFSGLNKFLLLAAALLLLSYRKGAFFSQMAEKLRRPLRNRRRRNRMLKKIQDLELASAQVYRDSFLLELIEILDQVRETKISSSFQQEVNALLGALNAARFSAIKPATDGKQQICEQLKQLVYALYR
jgi:hypothetical protein